MVVNKWTEINSTLKATGFGTHRALMTDYHATLSEDEVGKP